VAPVGPAGPGTGTAITVAGATAAGLSQALKVSAISPAETSIEYFMEIPFIRLSQAASLNKFAAAGRE
jgi:hypothetical protein